MTRPPRRPPRWLGRRVLFHVGRQPVPTYSACLYLGCVLGVWVASWVASTRGLDVSRFVLATLVLLVPALAGSRMLYVVRHWVHYVEAPRSVLRRGAGGAALYGGLAVCIVVSVPVLLVAGLSYWAFWDAASVTMLVGLVFTRVGCLLNGCCGGRSTSARMGLWLPDVAGHWERRIPTQLFELGFGVIVVAVVLVLQPHVAADGFIFAGVVASYTAARVGLQPFRTSIGRERGAGLTAAVSRSLS